MLGSAGERLLIFISFSSFFSSLGNQSLAWVFEYIGEMGKDYIYAVTPLLEDALMDRDLVHRQTACTTVKRKFPYASCNCRFNIYVCVCMKYKFDN